MAELFDIQLETDLSEFTSTVTDGGDLSQEVAAAPAGGATITLVEGVKNVITFTGLGDISTRAEVIVSKEY